MRQRQRKAALIVAIAMGLTCACGANKEAGQTATETSVEAQENATAEELYEAIAQTVSLPEMVSIDPNFNYGVSVSLCSSQVFYRAIEVTRADTIVLLYANDAQDTAQLVSELETAKAFDLQSAQDYNPEAYALFENSEIKTAGRLVYWVVSEDASAIEDVIAANK